jgi:hypothetical protein
MASFRDGLYLESMATMHANLKKKRSLEKKNNMKSSESYSPFNSNSKNRKFQSRSSPTRRQGKGIEYIAKDAIAEEGRRSAHLMRGLTIRDTLKVTVPFRNQANHHRSQTMDYTTGAGYFTTKKATRTKNAYSSPSKNTKYFAESYIPPGMSPTKSKNPSSSPTSPSIGDLKRLALKKQKEIDLQRREEELSRKRGEFPKRKVGRRGASSGGRKSQSRRRSFNEGSNSRRRRGGSRLASSSSSPAVKRSISSNTNGDNFSPPPSRVLHEYTYPNEKKLAEVDGRQAPLVPPSRRKLAETQEERRFRNGDMSNRKRRENDEEAQAQARLKVEQILTDVARGKAVNGSWGKSKPPVVLWPSSAQKNGNKV